MPDSFDQLKVDVAADPAGREALQAVIDEKATDFLIACVRFAHRMQLMDDPWVAQRILTDALLWLKDANQRASRELTVRHSNGGKGWGGVE